MTSCRCIWRGDFCFHSILTVQQMNCPPTTNQFQKPPFRNKKKEAQQTTWSSTAFRSENLMTTTSLRTRGN